jgi:hypothetical protein
MKPSATHQRMSAVNSPALPKTIAIPQQISGYSRTFKNTLAAMARSARKQR